MSNLLAGFINNQKNPLGTSKDLGMVQEFFDSKSFVD